MNFNTFKPYPNYSTWVRVNFGARVFLRWPAWLPTPVWSGNRKAGMPKVTVYEASLDARWLFCTLWSTNSNAGCFHHYDFRSGSLPLLTQGSSPLPSPPTPVFPFLLHFSSLLLLLSFIPPTPGSNSFLISQHSSWLDLTGTGHCICRPIFVHCSFV